MDINSKCRDWPRIRYKPADVEIELYAKFKIEIKDDEIILSRHGKGGKFKGFKHLFVEYKGIPCLYMYENSADVLKLKVLGIKLSEPTELAAVLMENFEIAYSTRDIMNYYMFRDLNLGG